MNTRSRGPRVAGTDGSDGDYRMTVENRYKLLATTRRTLLTVHLLQLAYAAVACGVAVLSYLGVLGRIIPFELVFLIYHLGYCGVVVVMGKNAAKNNAAGLLSGYVTAMYVTTVFVGAIGIALPFVWASDYTSFGRIVAAVVSVGGIALSLYGAQQTRILLKAVSKKDQ